MFGSLTINPLKLFGLPGTIFDVVWALTKAAWKKLPKPKTTLGKWIVYPIYAYIAVPGSVPYALYKAAGWLGYESEMDALMSILSNLLGGFGSMFLDMLGKGLFFLLASLFTLVS